MKKVLMFWILFLLFPICIFGQWGGRDPFPPKKQSQPGELALDTARTVAKEFNPDGPVGSLLLTCLGGIHTGNIDAGIQGSKNQNVGDLTGTTFSIKLECPASNSATLLLLFNYDSQKITPPRSPLLWKISQSNITILGGVKFFLVR
jgi:hypothetical protein